jgi:hypothetical protein
MMVANKEACEENVQEVKEAFKVNWFRSRVS